MGLGKTAQSISMLAWLQQYGGRRGPFLVIAPLTTLGHWQREVETWTEMVGWGGGWGWGSVAAVPPWLPGMGRRGGCAALHSSTWHATRQASSAIHPPMPRSRGPPPPHLPLQNSLVYT